MTPDILAEWFRRQGHRVVRSASSYWYDAAPGVFQAFPYHWVISPDDSEIRDLMLRHGMLAVRYSAPVSFRRGLASYHIELEEPYTLEGLKAQARNGVKTGMSHFSIEPIPFERLAMEGWALQRDTLDRQGRLRSMDREGWERLCRSASGLPGFEAWAATADGELAAALMVARLGSTVSVPYALSHRRFLGNHVNNALFYCVSREFLQREGVERIFFTVQSLDAPANVDEFKFRMGLRYKLVRQCVEFNPLVRPFATRPVHEGFRRLLQRDPSNPIYAKAEGMLRFHLEGRKPITEQAWPEHLLDCRASVVPPPTVLRKEKDFQVTTATPFDVPAFVDLHTACFSGRDNLAVLLGKPFLYAVYRWFVSSPESRILVARKGERILGFTAICRRPYLLPMIRACRGELAWGMLARPWLVLDRRIQRRMARAMVPFRRRSRIDGLAQIAYTAVDEGFRNRGIGKALKLASIEVCREWGRTSVATGVRPENQGALALNEGLGFVKVPALSTPWMTYLCLDLRGREDAAGTVRVGTPGAAAAAQVATEGAGLGQSSLAGGGGEG